MRELFLDLAFNLYLRSGGLGPDDVKLRVALAGAAWRGGTWSFRNVHLIEEALSSPRPSGE